MRTIFLTLLIIAPAFLRAQYTSVDPFLAYDNCEADPSWQWGGDRTKKWSYWTGADHILPGSSNTASMKRSSNYARKGSYSYQARITKDWSYNSSSNTHRSELAFSTPGQEPLGWRWAAVSIYLPSDFCLDQAPMTIAFNTKAQPDNYATPFRLDVRKGRYIAIRADVRSDGSVPDEIETDLGPVEKGVWVDWVYHRNFEMNSSGYLELYKNGNLVYSHYGPNFVQGSGRSPEGYLHTGLYKWPWLDPNGMGWGAPSCDNPIEVYYDEYKFGNDGASLQDFLIDKAEAPVAKPVAPSVAQPVSNIALPYNTTAKSVSLTGVFNDDGGASNLSLTVSGNSNATLVKTATISGSTLNLSLVAGTSGSAVIKLKATDKDGLSVETSFTVTVAAPVVQAPKVANPIPDQQLAFNTLTKSVALGTVFSDDKPASNLTYTASNSNNLVVSGVTVVNNVLNITLVGAVTGSAVITIKATDDDGLSVQDQFVVSLLAKASASSLFINTGGSTYTFEGQTWTADRSFVGGKNYANTAVISGTLNKQIYQTERYGNFKYNIPVAAGDYTVRLHFAEIFHSTVNKRKFNVAIENGQGVLTGYDIVARAGGAKIAKVEEFKSITVTDGVLNIDFTSVLDNAKVSAIEVFSVEQVNTAPKLVKAVVDQQLSVSIKSKSIDFDSVFTDLEDDGKLVYSITANTNPDLVTAAAFSGTKLLLTFNGNEAGVAAVKVRATDPQGLYAEETFNVSITNLAPVANAGADVSLELPASTTILRGAGTDEDGIIKSYSWTQVSGPAVVFNSKTIATPTISGLTTVGNYVFQLVVTDNVGIPGKADQVIVVVNPEAGLQVSSFVLVNASTGGDIREIKDGDVIDLSSTGNNLNIKALVTQPFAGRVSFSLTGAAANNRSETAAPYALFGDIDGSYNNWTPSTGTYTLTAIPYTETNGTEAGTALTVRFNVVTNGANTRTATTTVGEITELLSSSDHSGLKTGVPSIITATEAYPNPFTSQVNISFRVKQAAKVKMEIVNSSGKTVAQWPEENVIPEVMYRKVFSAGNNAAGLYFYRITTSKGEVKTGKIMLAK